MKDYLLPSMYERWRIKNNIKSDTEGDVCQFLKELRDKAKR